MVQRAARRGDDGVGAALQGADLAAVLLPAVDRRHEHARVAAVVVERFAHLKAEFTRGREDEKHGVFGFGADHVALEERERKRRRSSGAGGGLAQHVGAGKERGDRGFLNGVGSSKPICVSEETRFSESPSSAKVAIDDSKVRRSVPHE